MKFTFRVVVLTLIIAGTALATGCARQDPTSASPATAALLESMQRQMEQMSADLKEARAAAARNATTISNPGSGSSTSGVTEADLRRVNDRLDDLAARSVSRRELDALQLTLDTVQRDLKAMTNANAELLARNEALLKTAVSSSDFQASMSRLDARISEHAARLTTLETDLTAKLADLVTRLSQMTSAPGSPAVADMQNRLTALEAERKDLERQLAARSDEARDLKKKYEDLLVQYQKKVDELNEKNGTTTPGPVAPAQPPPGAAAGGSGAVSGTIMQVKEGASRSEVTALVRFPLNVEFAEGAKYNVFDRKGRKTGDFVAMTNSTPPQFAAREQWFGGYIKLMKADVVPMEKDRVSNLLKVPDLDAVPGDGAGGESNTPGGSATDPGSAPTPGRNAGDRNR
ncbi:MAG: hypothetical protein AB7K09_08040 [Planctomycetota bacterium]